MVIVETKIVKEYIEAVLEKHGASLVEITKHVEPETGKEEIVAFIKVDRHPYNVIKKVYKEFEGEVILVPV